MSETEAQQQLDKPLEDEYRSWLREVSEGSDQSTSLFSAGFAESNEELGVARIQTSRVTRALNSTFNLFDVGGKGFIAADDIQRLLINLGQSASADEIKESMKSISPSGELDYDAFVQFMEAGNSKQVTPDRLQVMFNCFDLDGGGYITLAKMRHAMTAFGMRLNDEDMEMVLNRYDTSGAGTLDIEDFALLLHDLSFELILSEDSSKLVMEEVAVESTMPSTEATSTDVCKEALACDELVNVMSIDVAKIFEPVSSSLGVVSIADVQHAVELLRIEREGVDQSLQWSPHLEKLGLGKVLHKVNHIAFIVSDVGRSATFYSQVIGLEQIRRPDFDRHGAWFTVGNLEVHLIKGAPVPQPPAPPNIGYLSLATFNIDKVPEILTALDVPFNVERVDGVTNNYFIADPDGYWIKICQAEEHSGSSEDASRSRKLGTDRRFQAERNIPFSENWQKLLEEQCSLAQQHAISLAQLSIVDREGRDLPYIRNDYGHLELVDAPEPGIFPLGIKFQASWTVSYSDTWEKMMNEEFSRSLQNGVRPEKLNIVDCKGRKLGFIWYDYGKIELYDFPERCSFPLVFSSHEGDPDHIGNIDAASVLQPICDKPGFVRVSDVEHSVELLANARRARSMNPYWDPSLHWSLDRRKLGLGEVMHKARHMTITVADLDASANFYTNVLGLQPIEPPTFSTEDGLWFTMGNVKLQLVKGTPVVHSGIDLIVCHISFETPHIDQVPVILKQLKYPFRQNVSVPKGGVKMTTTKGVNTDKDTDMIVKQYFFQDPDGYWIEVCNCDVLTKYCLGQNQDLCNYSEGCGLGADGGLLVSNVAIRLGKLCEKESEQLQQITTKKNSKRGANPIILSQLMGLCAAAETDEEKLKKLLLRRAVYGDICQSESPESIREILRLTGNRVPDALKIMQIRAMLQPNGRVHKPPAFYVSNGARMSLAMFRPKSFVIGKDEPDKTIPKRKAFSTSPRGMAEHTRCAPCTIS